jgi:hypothetical protein
VIAEEAQRCGMFFINQRWLGGLLTNFTTIQRSLGRLRDLEAMATDGRYDSLSKKEIARNEKEKRKLLEEPRRHPAHVAPARRDLRRRHRQGEDCRRRGAQAEDSGHRHRRHQLRSRQVDYVIPATTTPCGRSACSRRRSPTPSARAVAARVALAEEAAAQEEAQRRDAAARLSRVTAAAPRSGHAGRRVASIAV